MGCMDSLIYGVRKLRVPFFNKFLHRRRGERWGKSEGVPDTVVKAGELLKVRAHGLSVF